MITADIGAARIQAADALLAPANKGLLILRPEDLKIARQPFTQLQSLPATIRGRQYLGAKTSYRLDLGGDLQVIAESHEVGHDAYRTGEQVYLGIDAALARVIAS